MSQKLRYNLDSDGFISELGYHAHYTHEMEDDSPVDFTNFMQYRRAGNNWLKKSEE